MFGGIERACVRGILFAKERECISRCLQMCACVRVCVGEFVCVLVCVFHVSLALTRACVEETSTSQCVEDSPWQWRCQSSAWAQSRGKKIVIVAEIKNFRSLLPLVSNQRFRFKIQSTVKKQ